MSGRELVILLLGFAIVAVILRGLYVAIQARRGQIRLAIDKNIPQDVDLEAIELSELPGGGARVVNRSLEEVNRQNNALDSAQQRAEELDLGEEDDEQQIPMLMDAVELSDQQPEFEAGIETVYASAVSLEEESLEEESLQDEEALPEEIPEEETWEDDEDYEEDSAEEADFNESEFGRQEPSLANDSSAHEELDAEADEDEDADENPDDVLFDYGERSSQAQEEADDVSPVAMAQDNLASVMPDYEDTGEEAELEPVAQQSEEISGDDWNDEDDESEDSYSESHSEEESETEEKEEVGLASASFDEQLGDFSMTAGERIGHNPIIGTDESQSGLFEDDEPADEPKEPAPKSGFRSLFSGFGKKSKEEDMEKTPSRQPRLEAESADAEIDDTESRHGFFEDAEPVPETVSGLESESIEEEVVQSFEQVSEKKIRDELAEVRNKPETADPVTEASEVLVLNVMAREGRAFPGNDLMQVLITSGLKFGDMNIFHKRLSNDSNGPIIFSVANALNPGVFDLNNMEQFTTMGISLFLALPTPINNLDGFEQMLETAQQIRGALDGELKDDHRNVMTAQTIEHYRQRVRDFELRRLKMAGARG